MHAYNRVYLDFQGLITNCFLSLYSLAYYWTPQSNEKVALTLQLQ